MNFFNLKRNLLKTYEKNVEIGYTEVLEFLKENYKEIQKLSVKESAELKSILSRYKLINNDNRIFNYFFSSNDEPEIVNDIYRLGIMYKVGGNVQPDLVKAVVYLEKAANYGNKLAQFELAEMYMQGNGVEKIKEKAIKWYKACNDIQNTYSKDLSTMSIPDGVTSIDDFAFEGFENLINIKIPKSVKKIGEFAFRGCTQLKDVNIEKDSSIFIEISSFTDCNNLSQESKEKLLGITFMFVEYYYYYKKQFFYISRVVKKNITFYDAISFCNYFSKILGLEPVYSIEGDERFSEYNSNFEKKSLRDGKVIIRHPSANGVRLPSRDECSYFEDKVSNIWVWSTRSVYVSGKYDVYGGTPSSNYTSNLVMLLSSNVIGENFKHDFTVISN